MLVLGIESTCDETACAVVKDGSEILSNVVSSQIDLHQTYGGVVPELACRRHIDILLPVIDEALVKANLTLEEIDLIAVARGPGLIGALLIGLNTAKSLALATGKPLIGVNHIEAHLYAATMALKEPIVSPSLGVVLSGGHTCLVKMDSAGSYQLIGQTVDDAIGEAFDKVAKILELPYPGGPRIEALAKEGNADRFQFKIGQVKGRPFDFSFSGLKTAVLYTAKGQNSDNTSICQLTAQDKQDIAASFQKAAFSAVIEKAMLAAELHRCRSFIFGGGVTNNAFLRQMFANKAKDYRLHWPSAGLSLDNAAMIAGLGYHHYLRKGCGDTMSLEALTRIPLEINFPIG
jgi:N6-L-threonylcarbamoyladenine synthase